MTDNFNIPSFCGIFVKTHKVQRNKKCSVFHIWNWHSFTVILPHTGNYELVILLPSVLMSNRCYSFSGSRPPVNVVIIRSSSLCLMDCSQSELDAFLRRAKSEGKREVGVDLPRTQAGATGVTKTKTQKRRPKT